MTHGTRTRRIARIAACMPIVARLVKQGTEFDAVSWARREHTPGDGAPWLCTPFSHGTREESALADSNYRIIMADLDRVSAYGTDTRLDLWVGGRIETLMVRADDALALRAVQAWVDALADYPVADEEDYSELEWDRAHPGSDDEWCYAEEDCSCGRERA